MPVRIGANPIGWSNDDMRELGGDTPIETCLAEARQAGFEGMELGHKFPREPAALRAALAPHGLACVSGWYSAALLERDAQAEMRAMQTHLDLLREMGAEVLIIAETSNAIHGDRAKRLSARPVLDRAQWPRLCDRLTALAELTLSQGLRLVYHHHMGTVVQSADDIEMLMSGTGPALHLLLDTGHATWGGANPIALARRYRTRISHVHAKDVRRSVMQRARLEDWSFLDAVVGGVYTVPGDGIVDFSAVFRELAGYSGWIVVEAEQDPCVAHPLTYASLGYTNVRKALAAAHLI